MGKRGGSIHGDSSKEGLGAQCKGKISTIVNWENCGSHWPTT
jgi:hypothetical protein